jgi:hypothetical protein
MPLVRLGPLAVPTPSEVLTWTAATAGVVVALPERVDVLLGEVTRLLGVLDGIAGRVDGLVDRADGIVVEIEGVIGEARTITGGAGTVVADARGITGGAAEVVESARAITAGADGVVTEARGITTGAGEVVGSAAAASRQAQELLDLYRPMLEQAAPLTKKFVDDLAEEEIEAAIKLVDELPALAHHMSTDILPILETLDRVGPDLHELLDVTKDLRRAIDGIPGFSFLKRRGESREDDE